MHHYGEVDAIEKKDSRAVIISDRSARQIHVRKNNQIGPAFKNTRIILLFSCE
jgi:hypothetical protein